jgi:putative transposase
VICDRDSIFSKDLDRGVKAMGVRVLRTPARAPKVNALCERLCGSLRRERLDFLIAVTERLLKMTVEEWRIHYNRGRPHSSLGSGVPESNRDRIPASGHRHRLPNGHSIAKTAVLGGLHHEYRLVKEAA